jgi:hypothetical protein
MKGRRDLSLDALLALDGEVFFADPAGQYAVRFVVKQVHADAGRPHGLMYSLTLHDPSGERIVGFDNAHSVAAQEGPGGRRTAFDHRHRFRTVRPYDYRDAASLLEDFWSQVDAVLKEKGVLP